MDEALRSVLGTKPSRTAKAIQILFEDIDRDLMTAIGNVQVDNREQWLERRIVLYVTGTFLKGVLNPNGKSRIRKIRSVHLGDFRYEDFEAESPILGRVHFRPIFRLNEKTPLLRFRTFLKDYDKYPLDVVRLGSDYAEDLLHQWPHIDIGPDASKETGWISHRPILEDKQKVSAGAVPEAKQAFYEFLTLLHTQTQNVPTAYIAKVQQHSFSPTIPPPPSIHSNPLHKNEKNELPHERQKVSLPKLTPRNFDRLRQMTGFNNKVKKDLLRIKNKDFELLLEQPYWTPEEKQRFAKSAGISLSDTEAVFTKIEHFRRGLTDKKVLTNPTPSSLPATPPLQPGIWILFAPTMDVKAWIKELEHLKRLAPQAGVATGTWWTMGYEEMTQDGLFFQLASVARYNLSELSLLTTTGVEKSVVTNQGRKVFRDIDKSPIVKIALAMRRNGIAFTPIHLNEDSSALFREFLLPPSNRESLGLFPFTRLLTSFSEMTRTKPWRDAWLKKISAVLKNCPSLIVPILPGWEPLIFHLESLNIPINHSDRPWWHWLRFMAELGAPQNGEESLDAFRKRIMIRAIAESYTRIGNIMTLTIEDTLKWKALAMAWDSVNISILLDKTKRMPAKGVDDMVMVGTIATLLAPLWSTSIQTTLGRSGWDIALQLDKEALSQMAYFFSTTRFSDDVIERAHEILIYLEQVAPHSLRAAA